MKRSKKMLALLLALVMVLPMFGAGFSAETEREKVTILKAAGILTGDSTGNVHEDKQIKREELVAILVRMLKADSEKPFVLPEVPSFKDVPKTHWAYEVVEKAKHYGVTDGIGNGYFGAGQMVTYKQGLAFMTKMVGLNLDWNTLENQAKEYGFFVMEPSGGYPFLRGHAFDLAITAVNFVDWSSDNYEPWGKHIIEKIEKVDEELAQRVNGASWQENYVSQATRNSLVSGISKFATAEQAKNRFAVSSVKWLDLPKSEFDKINFIVPIYDDYEFMTDIDWNVYYNNNENFSGFVGHFDAGGGYGGFFDMENALVKYYNVHACQDTKFNFLVMNSFREFYAAA